MEKVLFVLLVFISFSMINFTMGQLKNCNEELDPLNQLGQVVGQAFDNSSFAELINANQNYSKISDFIRGFGRIDKIGNIVVETTTNQILCVTDQSYNKFVSPTNPMKLGLDILIWEITEVKDMDYTISLSMTMIASWKDFRIQLPTALEEANFSSLTLSSATSKELWQPNLKLHGLRNIKRNMRSVPSSNTQDSITYEPKTGTFKQTFELLITMTCSQMDFTDFPFDTHVCPLLVYDQRMYGLGSEINVENVFYHGEKIKSIPFTVSLNKHPSEFLYETHVAGVDINLERKSMHINWTYFFPMIFYVMLSWISFAIPKQIVSYEIDTRVLKVLFNKVSFDLY